MTERLVNVPTDVMLGWAAFVTDPAVFAKLTVPVRFATCTFDSVLPPPMNKEALTFPDEYKPVRVPTEVILGCDAFVTLWAVPTVLTFAPFMFEIAEPFEATSSPLTVKEFRIPKLVMLG